MSNNAGLHMSTEEILICVVDTERAGHRRGLVASEQ